MSAASLGLAAGIFRSGVAGPAGGVQGAGDFRFAEAGLAGGGGQLVQVGGRVGVQGAVGGPEQAGVAVALGLGCDPPDQAGDPVAGERAAGWLLVLAVGFQEPDDCLPVQAAVGLC
jgi:hypothetical protein